MLYMNFLEIETIKNSKFNIFIILFLVFIVLIMFILIFNRNEINKINILDLNNKNNTDNNDKNDKNNKNETEISIDTTNKHAINNINSIEKKIENTEISQEMIYSNIQNYKKENELKNEFKDDLKDKYNEKKEVYNISQNIYTYEDAPYVCKLFGGRLATKNELQQEFLKGADWCNYGWSENQEALYPTQKKSWDKLQKTDNYKDMCGKPGINGGYFDNPDLKFGVNCFGVKPKQTDNNTHSISINTLKTTKELEIENKMKELELTKDTIQFLPFNHKEWSKNEEISSTNFINSNS